MDISSGGMLQCKNGCSGWISVSVGGWTETSGGFKVKNSLLDGVKLVAFEVVLVCQPAR